MDDPFAVMFIQGARLDNHLPVPVDEVEHDSMLSSRFAGVRTRVFDDFLVNAEDDGIDQVVILAVGSTPELFGRPGRRASTSTRSTTRTCSTSRKRFSPTSGRCRCAGGTLCVPYLGAQEENDLLRVIRDLSAPGSI